MRATPTAHFRFAFQHHHTVFCKHLIPEIRRILTLQSLILVRFNVFMWITAQKPAFSDCRADFVLTVQLLVSRRTLPFANFFIRVIRIARQNSAIHGFCDSTSTHIQCARTRFVLPRPINLRGQGPENQNLRRNIDDDGCRRPALPRPLQRLEANVRALHLSLPFHPPHRPRPILHLYPTQRSQTTVSWGAELRRSILTRSLSRWDEWVPANRLLKITEGNLALQKNLQQTNTASVHGGSTTTKAQSKAAAGMNKESVSTRAGARKDGTRGTKRAREEVGSLFSLTLGDT